MIKLKELRNSKKLLQSEVAKNIGVTTSAYAYYERGEREPNCETLKKLAKYFEITIDELLGLEKSEFFSEARIPKTEIQQLYDELLPEQQAQIIGFAKGMLVANKSNIFDLTKKK